MVGAEPRAFAYRASVDCGGIHKVLSDFFQPDLDLCTLLEVTLRALCLTSHTPRLAFSACSSQSTPLPPHSSPGADKPGSCGGSYPQ